MKLHKMEIQRREARDSRAVRRNLERMKKMSQMTIDMNVVTPEEKEFLKEL
jgi:hypothetical protein